MIRKSGICTWPRSWASIHSSTPNKPTGEVGALQQVLMNDSMDTQLFMFIEFNGLRYMGLMAFDDRTSFDAIYTLLKSKIGLSITEIGDLDVPHFL